MRTVLWIGDAVAATGFARCTHHTLDVLRESWDVHVLGLNYMGDPHPFPYPIYPCWPGGDGFGIGRLKKILKKITPEMVIIQNDPWNIPEYLKALPKDMPVVAAMPVDGKNCRGKDLNGLTGAIFWTRFGLEQARVGGYTRPAEVIPLGVDLGLYAPKDQHVSRERVGLKPPLVPEDAFIIGNVNRNQPRKRLDLTVKYFADWVNSRGIQDAWLFLYVAPTGDQGIDVAQLMYYYGLRGDRKRLILVEPEIGMGNHEEELPFLYSCFDVQLTTTQGEGWGLTTMEGMACGVPQIVPDWSALGEWPEETVAKVPCFATTITPNRINVIGGVPDEDATLRALDLMYATRRWSDNQPGWAQYRKAGLDLVSRPEYRWRNIGERFAAALEEMVTKEREEVSA